MSKEEQNAEEPIQPPAMGGMLLTMLFMFYIILNPELRTGMGDLAAQILEPEIDLFSSALVNSSNDANPK